MRWYVSTRARLGVALGVSSLASVGFWVVGALRNHSAEYLYLIQWNLVLAWIPLILAVWLESMLQRRLWSSWPALLVTIAWLCFLPNSFYILSDFVHLGEVPRVDIVADVVMFGSCALNGFILGYLSLFIVHTHLLKRLSVRASGVIVTGVLATTSFAIYIGRDLRWNSWDVLLNPASLLFDVSDRLINSSARPQAIGTTLSFFVLIGSVYLVVWYAARMLRQQKISD